MVLPNFPCSIYPLTPENFLLGEMESVASVGSLLKKNEIQSLSVSLNAIKFSPLFLSDSHFFTIIPSLIRLVKYFKTYFVYNVAMDFKNRLKDLRTANNLSQMQLAMKTGLSQSAIAKWELGKTEPTASAIIALAKFFNESTDYLLGLED